jgi:hypothetical protein
VKLNLNDVDPWEASGGVTPPGQHQVVIDDVEESESTGGHPQLVVRMRVEDGPYAATTITDWIVVTPATLGKVKQFLAAAGYDVPDGDFDLDASGLTGRRVGIIVREEPKPDGELRNRVKAYLDPGQVASDVPADTEGLPVGAGSGSRDDDIPFRVRNRLPREHRDRGLFDPSL